MGIVEIISLLVSGFAVVISLLALLNNYRFNRPKITFRIHSEKPEKCCYAYANLENGMRCFGYFQVSIANMSSQPGSIANVSIIYKGNKYNVETVGMPYEIEGFSIRINRFFPQDPEKMRLVVPMVIPPYSALIGYFRIVRFPGTSEDLITVTVEVTYIDTKIRTVRYENIPFTDVTNRPDICTTHTLYQKPVEAVIIENIK